ncbi:response regulator [Desulfobacterota bacterium AH_259_B03_O07]|nr:response regulator [Desulfobacterota bacterium AH_259_B03_O07]
MKVILIADEDEKIRNLVRFAFSGDMGYRVESATTGDEALSKSKVIKPDIVIADVTLSNKNGFEVSREIKNDPSLKGTYIILLSPSSTFDNTKAKEALADDVIVKSLDLTNIIGDITEKLEALSSAGRRRRISPLVISISFFVIICVIAVFLFGNFLLDQLRPHSSRFSKVERGKNIVITINGKEEVFIDLIDRKKYSTGDLETVIQSMKESSKEEVDDDLVIIRADSSVSHDSILNIMKEIKKSGLNNIRVVQEIVLPFKFEQIDEYKSFSEEEKTVKTSHPEDILTITVVGANIRSGPSTNYNIVGLAKSGDLLESVNEERGNWMKVRKLDGTEGWISKKLVKPIDQ